MINVNEKLAGLLVPVFALRGKDDLGIGDTTAVIDAIDFCSRNFIGVLQTLPVNETGGDNSPYNAISSIALDPVMLTVTPVMVPGLSEGAHREIIKKHDVEKLKQGSVKYPQVKKLKLELLESGYEGFKNEHLAKNSPRAKDFAQFQKEQAPWLTPYTLFRTLVEVHKGDTCWPKWEKDLKTPESAEKWLAASSKKQELEDQRQFYAYVQWIAFKQWKDLRALASEKGVRLMGDMPFGVSRYSADVWAQQEIFNLEWSGGAPPEKVFQADPFTMKWGQNWGIPIYYWDKNYAQDFSWWKQRVAKLVEVFHYFRIDHVLGFFRIYSFPWMPERNDEFFPLSEEEAAKKTGGRLPQFLPRADEEPEDAAGNEKEGKALLKIIAEAAGKNGVVAEDLGVVPPYVKPVLQELGMAGFTIPQWEKDKTTGWLIDKKELPLLSLATWATHDHPTIVSYYEELVKSWKGPNGHAAWQEIQRLMRFVGMNEENPPESFTDELHAAMIKSLMESNCWLAVVMITDLLATTQRFNQPGMSADSNWSERLAEPLSYYEQNEPYKAKVSEFARLIKQTHRVPHVFEMGTIK